MLLEQVGDAAARARNLKIVRCRAEGRTDAPPVLQLMRGVKPIAMLILVPDRKTMMHDIDAAIAAFDADVAFFTIESYIRKEVGEEDKINPVTGRAWKLGDYQDVAEHHGGLEKGWVQETISTWGVNRAGDFAYRSDPYTWDGTLPVFGEPIMSADGVQGGMVEAMHRIMNKPGVSAVYLHMHGVRGLPSRDDRDVVVATTLAPLINGQIALVSVDEDERGATFDAAMQKHPSFFRPL